MTTFVFPLYDQLLYKVNERKDTSSIDIDSVCSTISWIQDVVHWENIQTLIIHHEILNTGGLSAIVPYNGKTMLNGRGILYHMVNLPPTLQHIIAQYIEEFSCASTTV